MIARLVKVLVYFLRFVYYNKISPSNGATDVIYDAVSDLGGVYIKLIQFVCLRTEVFSNTDKMRFLSFYDQAPVVPLDIMQVLRQELTSDRINHIHSVETIPFAAGSFAQVYRATLADGSNVIIKVKRSGIKSKIHTDLIIVRLLSMIFDWVYYQTLVDVSKLVQEFSRMTYSELDYEREARNANYFHNAYRDHAIVKIPYTYMDLSTSRIIVQEYIDGVPLTTLIRLKYENKDYKKWLKENYNTDIFVVLRSLPYELAIQAFNLDYYYADPHCGNVFVLRDNRYAIVDFGILGESPRNKRTYYDLLKTITDQPEDMNVNLYSENLMKFGANDFLKNIELLDYSFSSSENKVLDQIIKSLSLRLNEIIEKMRVGEQSQAYDFTELLIDSIKNGSKFGVRAPSEQLAMMRSSQLFKSYAVFLEPEWVYMRKAFELVLKNVDRKQLVDKDDVSSKQVHLEDALESIYSWAGTIAESDYPLYVKVDKLLQTMTNA